MKPVWYRLLILMAVSGWHLSVAAQDLGWRVKPSVCIVKELGEACQLQLDIQIWGDLPPDSCLFLSDEQLQCWQTPRQHIRLSLSYSEDSVISMRQDDRDLLTETLEVKALSAVRQRVRKPWSLF
ncbi:hypothetical protein GCM10009092_43460 [Bowmanella denitrificans]|uniref:DUF3019 domain-containing protein n=1 Tax=Bowmanella denitrificans TaxID=366582 RepID=A0ABP3HQM7_9ALTE